MAAFWQVVLVCTVFSAPSLAKAGAHDAPRSGKGVEAVIMHWLESQPFSGGRVQDLLLADPEPRGAASTYHGEFVIRRAGRLIRCEDWHFTVQRVRTGWTVLGTERGRCND